MLSPALPDTWVVLTHAHGTYKQLVHENRFAFENMLIGEYTIEIQNPKGCWKNKMRTIKVDLEHNESILFE